MKLILKGRFLIKKKVSDYKLNSENFLLENYHKKG
jgi:hypothetical protein